MIGGAVAKARKEVELAVRIGNRPGALGQVLSILAEQGINVLAYCAYSEREQGVVLLVCEDPFKAKLILKADGFECKANTVVLVGAADHVGAAAQLGMQLGRASVDILYSYASSAGTGQFYAVFKTADDEKAIRVIEAKAHVRAAA